MWADVILSTLQSCPGAQTFVHQSLPLPQNKVLNMMTWHPHVDWLNPVFGWASWHQLNHPPFSLICLKFVIPWKQAKIPNPCELPNHPGTQIVYMPDMAAGEHLWSRSPACPSQATSCFHLTSSLTNSIPNSSWTKRRRRNATTNASQLDIKAINTWKICWYQRLLFWQESFTKSETEHNSIHLRINFKTVCLAAKMETVPMVLQWRNSEAQIESRNAWIDHITRVRWSKYILSAAHSQTHSSTILMFQCYNQ